MADKKTDQLPDWLNEGIEGANKQQGGAQGFAPGAHTVHIGLAEATKDSKDRDIIKVIVLGENDEEGEATLWLHTEGGAKMAVTKVLGILVHNTAEEKKATISDFGKRVFAGVKEPAEVKEGLIRILNEKLIGKEAYIYAEPQEKYDTTKYVDLWHYDQSKRTPAEPTTYGGIDIVEDVDAGNDDPFAD
jgi:hypothetical protein